MDRLVFIRIIFRKNNSQFARKTDKKFITTLDFTEHNLQCFKTTGHLFRKIYMLIYVTTSLMQIQLTLEWLQVYLQFRFVCLFVFISHSSWCFLDNGNVGKHKTEIRGEKKVTKMYFVDGKTKTAKRDQNFPQKWTSSMTGGIRNTDKLLLGLKLYPTRSHLVCMSPVNGVHSLHTFEWNTVFALS